MLFREWHICVKTAMKIKGILNRIWSICLSGEEEEGQLDGWEGLPSEEQWSRSCSTPFTELGGGFQVLVLLLR